MITTRSFDASRYSSITFTHFRHNFTFVFNQAISLPEECCHTKYRHGCNLVIGMRPQYVMLNIASIQQFCKLYLDLVDYNKK